MNVVYVDKNDNVIGSGSISNAMDNGIIVRISRVFLLNSRDEMLLQRRSNTMTFPGKWDSTAAGHVDEGEEYYEVALRELQEEMGVSEAKLQEIATFYLEETNETKVKRMFNKIFVGVYDGKVSIDNNEVSDYKWVPYEELGSQMEQDPDNFTQGFREAFKVYRASAN